MFFETSIIPEYPRYHSNCAAIALHHSVSSNKPFTFTQHHGNNYRQTNLISLLRLRRDTQDCMAPDFHQKHRLSGDIGNAVRVFIVAFHSGL